MSEPVLDPIWSSNDRARALEIYSKFGHVYVNFWAASADTTRAWKGGKDVLDTRIPIKNNAEYHGLEIYAWQYFHSTMYEEASEHFYLAALWRREDSEMIGSTDDGHRHAEDFCLRMGRFSHALHLDQRAGRPFSAAEDFGLSDDLVTNRESKAGSQIEVFLDAQRRDSVPE
ncbi:MAG TPA: hypothetical protein VIQ76_19890 [Propionibacteriaceae bacterium]